MSLFPLCDSWDTLFRLQVKDFSRDCLSISSIYRIISNQKEKLGLQIRLYCLWRNGHFSGSWVDDIRSVWQKCHYEYRKNKKNWPVYHHIVRTSNIKNLLVELSILIQTVFSLSKFKAMS